MILKNKSNEELLARINELEIEVDRFKSAPAFENEGTKSDNQSTLRALNQRNAIAQIATDEIIAFGSQKNSFQRIIEIGSVALEVQRVSVWLFSEDQEELKCAAMFDQKTNSFTEGFVLRCEDNPTYFEQIKKNSRIYVNDARKDPRTNNFTADYFEPLNIYSLIDAGIHVHGKLAGVICMEHTGQIRNWHPDEESFASTLAAVAAQTLINQERNQAESALWESEAQFKKLIEGMPMPVAYLNEKREVTFINDQFTEVFGYTIEDVPTCAQWWNLCISDSEDRDSLLQEWNTKLEGAKRDSGSIAKGEYALLNKQGKLLYIILSAIHIGPNLLVAFKDITARKRTETELLNAKNKAEESDRLKSAFLANMSHEIRTPLNGVLGFTSLLKTPSLTESDRLEYVSVIEKSGERLLNTVNDIVNLSKIEAGQIDLDVSVTNINEQTDFIYSFFRPKMQEKGLEFSVNNSLPSSEVNIHTDREKIYAILTNLVNNALKFTQSGFVEFGYQLKGEYLEFYVKDSGPGIPKKSQGMIFERFRQENESIQRHFEGSGLGLAISKAYAEMLSGEMWLISDAGQGAEFRFTVPYMPVFRDKHDIDKDATSLIKNSKKQLKILLAEDDETSMKLMELTLEPLCSELIHAKTGIEVIELLEKHEDVDLVLMDIHMPEMDGYTATKKIRSTNKDLLVIAQTSFGMNSDRTKALEAGCNDYISKPINSDLLTEIIHRHWQLKKAM